MSEPRSDHSAPSRIEEESDQRRMPSMRSNASLETEGRGPSASAADRNETESDVAGEATGAQPGRWFDW